ncbi:hypothetical protein TWF694_004758 [Orbilia ellipsospora]|uniref:Uncharacterized protein n=1 Tax=Orbilia ellipsospora TaxID=2528407 RepID=A0AAV9WYN0_9PEZI
MPKTQNKDPSRQQCHQILLTAVEAEWMLDTGRYPGFAGYSLHMYKNYSRASRSNPHPRNKTPQQSASLPAPGKM